MFTKVVFATVSLFALFQIAAAVALPGGGDSTTVNQCNTGDVQCCNSVQSSDSENIQSLAGLLGIALGSVTVPVGLSCSPISVAGIGGNSCSAQPVCCDNNQFNGLINVGCTPVNLNL